MFTDVLIVGAGPTGLMLANQLGRRGMRAMIIDRHSGPAQQTRAMAVQARTLEIYSKLGIAERALELGTRGNGANMWSARAAEGARPARRHGRGLSPFPFVLMLGQDDNERIMGDQLRAGASPCSGTPSSSRSSRTPSHVTATLKQPDGSTANDHAPRRSPAATAARSAVREMSGIAFPGAPYEHVFFVADTEATGPDGARRAQRLSVARRISPVLPDARDGSLARHRHPAARAARTGRPDLRGRDPVASRRRREPALSFKACSWFSTYRIHHRCAERFRDRRCFLLGDAAHIHSPVGAQGMNTGLQDAYNLAWKLALVASGAGGPGAARHYEAERIRSRSDCWTRPTGRSGSSSPTAGSPGSSARGSSRNVAAFAMTRKRVQTLAFRTVLADRHPLPREPAVADARRALPRRRAARRRPLPVAAAARSDRTARARTCSRGSTTRASICS